MSSLTIAMRDIERSWLAQYGFGVVSQMLPNNGNDHIKSISSKVARGEHDVLRAIQRENSRMPLQFLDALQPPLLGPHDHDDGITPDR